MWFSNALSIEINNLKTMQDTEYLSLQRPISVYLNLFITWISLFKQNPPVY